MREKNGHQEFWHNLFFQCREAEGGVIFWANEGGEKLLINQKIKKKKN